MARLVRGDEVIDLWVDDGADGTWLRARAGDGPICELRRAPRAWVERGFANELSMRLRDGWRRARDPAREVDVDDEPREPRLEAALAADLGDAAAALVYADWYQQQEHPRGDLIAVQHALAARPGDAELRAHEAALFRDWREHLLGPLGQPLANPYGQVSLALSWQHGFVRAARLEGIAGTTAAGQLVWELLRHPSARFLRELVVASGEARSEDGELALDMLLHAGPTPPLCTLHVLREDLATTLGDLTELGARYPLLEDVVLTGYGDAELGALSLPRARRLAFRTATLYRETAAALACAELPALAELELWFGSADSQAGCTAADLAPLWASGFRRCACCG